MLKKIEVPAPLDIENKCPRKKLFFQLSIPEDGIGPNTGLIIYIGGYGSQYDDPYTSKLLTYLSNEYDCIAASVQYFGSELYGNATAVPADNFFVNLKKQYGVVFTQHSSLAPESLLTHTLEQLSALGITELNHDCQAIIDSADYNSFGFLPAIDHLEVTWHVLNFYKPNRTRLYVLGTSCGGHIASMLLKFAPNTYRMIVENSGFTSPKDNMPGIYGVIKNQISGVSIIGIARRRWKRQPGSYFFSESHLKIRSLIEVEHFSDSPTCLYSYHWEGDTIACIERKRHLVDVFADKLVYKQQIIKNRMLDGQEFKTPEHGMQASMRKLFFRAYSNFIKINKFPKSITDFDIGTKLSFNCAGLIYEISFSDKGGLSYFLNGTASENNPFISSLA